MQNNLARPDYQTFYDAVLGQCQRSCQNILADYLRVGSQAIKLEKVGVDQHLACDHWISVLQFELRGFHVLMRFDYTSQVARKLAETRAGIDSQRLPDMLKHDVIQELLNTVMGQIKAAFQAETQTTAVPLTRVASDRDDPRCLLQNATGVIWKMACLGHWIHAACTIDSFEPRAVSFSLRSEREDEVNPGDLEIL